MLLEYTVGMGLPLLQGYIIQGMPLHSVFQIGDLVVRRHTDHPCSENQLTTQRVHGRSQCTNRNACYLTLTIA